MEDNFYYLVFVLGYDLLQDYFRNSDTPECDLVFDKCIAIIKDFKIWASNEENTEKDISTYDLLVEYLEENIL